MARGPDGPEELGDILGRTLARQMKRSPEELRARRRWAEVVGPEIAARTEVVSFRRRVLRVSVASSALLAELQGIYKRELVAALGEGAEPVIVGDIRFELKGAPPGA